MNFIKRWKLERIRKEQYEIAKDMLMLDFMNQMRMWAEYEVSCIPKPQSKDILNELHYHFGDKIKQFSDLILRRKQNLEKEKVQ